MVFAETDTPNTEPKPINLKAPIAHMVLGEFPVSQFSIAENGHEADRSTEVFRLSRDPSTYEVNVESDITLEDYKQMTSPEDWSLLRDWAKRLHGKQVVFINPTMEGGGVAMMRPPIVHLLRQFGIDTHWYVMSGRKSSNDPDPFVFTKQMHNISQRRAAPDERISEEGKAVHRLWAADNAAVLINQEAIRTADVIVIDDPQPAPLKKYIDAVNPKAKIVWRSHIDTSERLMADRSTPQSDIAAYLLDECGIRDVDAIITHPVDSFVYPGMWGKTFFAPATIELQDDLNRSLNESEIKDGIDFINSEIAVKNAELLSQGRVADLQSAIDTSRKRLALVARFDESKGMDKAMALGVLARQKLRASGMPEHELPQIIIVGNGSVDDPSGVPMFENMLRIRREHYASDKADIILMRLKHNYKAINALMYPCRQANLHNLVPVVGMQTSEAEGLETRITEWIRHGVPVVVANRGGMPLQVIEGRSGLILDFDKPSFDLERGARYIHRLMSDPELFTTLHRSSLEAASKFNSREFSTIANATRLLRVFHSVLTGSTADKQWKISDLVDSTSRLAA